MAPTRTSSGAGCTRGCDQGASAILAKTYSTPWVPRCDIVSERRQPYHAHPGTQNVAGRRGSVLRRSVSV
eukprot:633014-Prymnesium_polylepis.1